MTAEMGPRDVELDLFERLAARMTQYTTRLVSMSNDDTSIRYEPTTATLSISGESEQSGDEYERGKVVFALLIANPLLAAFVMTVFAEVAAAGAGISPTLGVVLMLPFLASALFTIGIVQGSMELVSKTDVMDHTMPPQPEALDELQEQYVDGDLDEEELADEVAEVWANE